MLKKPTRRAELSRQPPIGIADGGVAPSTCLYRQSQTTCLDPAGRCSCSPANAVAGAAAAQPARQKLVSAAPPQRADRRLRVAHAAAGASMLRLPGTRQPGRAASDSGRGALAGLAASTRQRRSPSVDPVRASLPGRARARAGGAHAARRSGFARCRWSISRQHASSARCAGRRCWRWSRCCWACSPCWSRRACEAEPRIQRVTIGQRC